MFSERVGRILSTGASPTDDSGSDTSEARYSVTFFSLVCVAPSFKRR
jgi:hypothetical protein